MDPDYSDSNLVKVKNLSRDEFTQPGKSYITRSKKNNIEEKSDSEGNDDKETTDLDLKSIQQKRNNRWGAVMEKRFFDEFGPYVKRNPKYPPMPGMAKMADFVKRHNCTFGASTVRVKINNERAKYDRLIDLKMKQSGLDDK